MDRGERPAATDDLTLRDRAVAIADTLVVSDLHLGKGSAAGLELPIGAGTTVVERLAALLDRFDPATVVLAGDVLHAFGTVPHTVTDAFEGITAAVRRADADLIVIEGNHDTMLEQVWDGDSRTSYRIEQTVVCHGHVEPDERADRYVVGHDHPTLAVEGRRRPCYLAGDSSYRGADLVMLPAFSRLLQGVAVNDMAASDFQSPLVTDADTLQPIVWDDDAAEALGFPPLGSLRHRL